MKKGTRLFIQNSIMLLMGVGAMTFLGVSIAKDMGLIARSANFKVGECGLFVEEREFEDDYITIIRIDSVGKQFYKFTYVKETLFPSLIGHTNTNKITTIDTVYDKIECPKPVDPVRATLKPKFRAGQWVRVNDKRWYDCTGLITTYPFLDDNNVFQYVLNDTTCEGEKVWMPGLYPESMLVLTKARKAKR